MRRLIALFCAIPLVLAACGGDDKTPASSSGSSSSGAGGGASLDLTAQELGPGKFGFSKKTLTAKSGKVTLKLDLPAGLKASHGIAVEGNGVDKDGPVVQAGSSSSVTVDLKPGKYEFYCPVPGHKDEGMKGELTVS
jgi:uncharacterized cupredoxin-like copper-binding protein